ncbi:MAG: inorganic diphosphatase [Lewinellaceae bacterium]|nr:inorganic diphosphatase [Phaeodactylibacter sp.]MCB0612857.1 inorganic diphosphatase [Phaeodactylibacter sp.]MCB9351461.1 inorganic diphosphatase [Lewinellaceae bacterium]
MMKPSISFFLSLSILSLLGCVGRNAETVKDYEHLPTYTEQGINVVVEIPAGTNHKIEYDKEKKVFVVDQRNGKDRIIDFLPYPGNYGFIPSTYMDSALGGDGDALDVLVIGESVPKGTVMAVKPIAALLLMDEGEEDTKIIAVPADPQLRVMKADNFQDFSITYDGAKHIIETWFLYYDGLGTAESKGWKDGQYAMKEIEKWAIGQ